MKRIYLFSLFASILCVSQKSEAQISITSLRYSPAVTDFNTFNPTSAATFSSTLPAGWSGTSSGTAAYRGRSAGTGTNGGYYGLGASGDFNLGALRSGGTGNITYSVSYVNNSGQAITSLRLEWNYEQWGYSNTSGWDCTGTGQLASNATVNAADFTGSASGTSGTVSTTNVSFILTGLNIANGQSFGIQWVTTDPVGGDNAVGIDDFSIIASATSLPLTFTSFTAQPAASGVQLDWRATCNTARHFIVEGSADGKSFESINTIAARKTSCGSKSDENYSVVLSQSQSERFNFYRIAGADDQGTLSRTKAIALRKKEALAQPISLAPNPASNSILISGLMQGQSWRISDSYGRTVSAGIADQSSTTIDIQALAGGMYFFTSPGAEAIRFVKQ